MTKFIPKVEIIEYFDELINQVDRHFEECLGKYNQDQVLGELKCFQVGNRDIELSTDFVIGVFKSIEPLEEKKSDGQWSESTKIVDYLNQVRMKAVDELKTAQKDCLEYYKRNLAHINSLLDQSNGNIDEMRSRLLGDKFYFKVFYQPPEQDSPWVFQLYTFVTDFYMSQFDIDLLEYFLLLL